MKTHGELIDNFGEASWALAMEYVAIRQGEEARELEVRLNSDPAAAVPEHTLKGCREAMRKAFAPSPVQRARTVLARVILVAVLCGVLTTVACAISPSFREFIMRIFSYVTEEFTAITFLNPEVENVGENQGDTDQVYYGIRFEWLPDGYECVDGGETPESKRVDFENLQSDYIRVRVSANDELSAYNYNSELGNTYQVEIGDFDGSITETEGYDLLFWIDTQKNKTILIFSNELSNKDLILMAEGLKY